MGFTNGFNVAPVGRAEGLSLWWDNSLQVQIMGASQHYIDAHCKIVDVECVFRFTGIYGTSYKAERA
ncbi:hypothetical protein COP1_032120 [Malus domestica]